VSGGGFGGRVGCRDRELRNGVLAYGERRAGFVWGSGHFCTRGKIFWVRRERDKALASRLDGRAKRSGIGASLETCGKAFRVSHGEGQAFGKEA